MFDRWVRVGVVAYVRGDNLLEIRDKALKDAKEAILKNPDLLGVIDDGEIVKAESL